LKLINKLRCPDCSGINLSSRTEPDDTACITISCGDCSREIVFADGILKALPSSMRVEQARNRHYYDEMSSDMVNPLVRRGQSRNHRIKRDRVVMELGLTTGPPRRSILEFGVGYGAHGTGIAELGHEYSGVDISEGLLVNAQKRFPVLKNASLACADATCTPFRSESFDGVFCVATLHHLPSPEHGVREALRVLRREGRFCFLEPRRYYPTQFVQWLLRPKTEVSALQMTARNLVRWVEAVCECHIQVSANVFTPNGPSWMVSVWDRIDRFCLDIPALHPLSVQICISGVKL
jgi:ubiquinone/menaquinone biosynthesis C-methylase UbiE